VSALLAAVRLIALALSCAGASLARADDAAAAQGASLRAKYHALQERLANNQFQRPLYLESSEGQGEVAGDIHAVINSPFSPAAVALSAPEDWCEILILHVNTKGCRTANANQGNVLSVWIGRNQQQPLADASRVDFAFRVDARSDKYLRVGLSAEAGPMGTRDYRIVLEAIPAENGKTFVRFAYSYGFGSFGRLAMQTYLATVGRNRVGFTVVGVQPDGQVRHIGGVRGVVERNTMRYFAAIEAFLGAQSGTPQARFEKRIRDWYAATELYARQLHEVEQAEYLEMKRKEILRQQAGPA
jgi:hypothetical protein